MNKYNSRNSNDNIISGGDSSSSSSGGSSSGSNSNDSNSNSNSSSSQYQSGGNKTQSQIDSETKYPSTFDVLMGLMDVGDYSSSDGYIDSAGVIHYKDKYPPLTEPGYYSSTLNYTTMSDTKSILDKMSGVTQEQQKSALEYSRSLHNDVKNIRSAIREINSEADTPFHHLKIGDITFQVPPEYISITDNSATVSNVALRQANSVKTKTGHSSKNITVTLFLNGINQINGFESSSPFDYKYYSDGLLGMIAQFRCTPFLPIDNEYINTTFGIYTVALKSMNISTVKGFPNCLEIALLLQEFNAEAFIEKPNIYFEDSIEWDLQRYFYQRYINKNLNVINDILDDSVELRVLDLQKVNNSTEKEFDVLNGKNYTTVLDSSSKNFYVTSMEVGISNIFSTQQLQAYESPSMQYLGGNDTSIVFTIETTDNSVVQNVSNILTTTQTLSRNNKEYFGLGFVKINNSLANMFGVNYFMINNVATETVPEFPGLSIIQFECVSYDISSKEILTGFRPFDGDRKGTLDDLISKKRTGLYQKVKQDNITEKKLTTFNLYPDLDLPTYSEVDTAISKINKFKGNNNLDLISYSKMPNIYQEIQVNGPKGVYKGYVDPDFYFKYDATYSNMNEAIFEAVNTPVSDSSSNSKSRLFKAITSDSFKKASGSVSATSVKKIPIAQSKTPNPVIGRMFDVGENDEEFTEAWVKGNEQYKYITGNGSSGTGTGDGSSVNINGVGQLTNITGNAVADLALSVLGRSWYFWGAFGGEEITQEYYNKMNKAWPGYNNKAEQRATIGKGWLAFDCSSLASWCLRKCGVKEEGFRKTSSDFHRDWDKSVSRSELQPGDILRRPGHVGVYIGNGETVEANSPTRGVNKCKLGSYTDYGRYNGVPTTSELMQKLGMNNSNNEESGSNDTHNGGNNGSNLIVSPNSNSGSSSSNSGGGSSMIVSHNRIVDKKISASSRIMINSKTDNEFARRPAEGVNGDTPPSSSNGGNSNNNNSSSNNTQTSDNGATYTSTVTSSMIDAHLGGMIANKGALMVQLGQKENVNPALIASIAMHESANGTSNFCKKYNNCCGIMKPGGGGGRHFDSIDACLEYTFSLLNRNYISKGKKSLEDIGAMYCPVGAANDPGKLNQYWVPGVAKYYKQITGEDYDETKATNGGSIDGSVASGSSGDGGLHLLYLGASQPPKRYPSKNYMVEFSNKAQKLSLSNLGKPVYADSPYNILKDEEIEEYEDKEETNDGYKPYSENWNINRNGYTNNQNVTNESNTVVNGEEVDAQFTAYYPANDTMQGGFYDALGNRLDPSKLTCAAPKDIPFHSKITVKGTGTSRDNVTYTVTDRGGAIKVVNGVYHIDLLMSNKTEAYSFGRRNGKAIIQKATGSSSSSSKSVNTKSINFKEYDINLLSEIEGITTAENTKGQTDTSSVWSYDESSSVKLEQTNEIDKYKEFLRKPKVEGDEDGDGVKDDTINPSDENGTPEVGNNSNNPTTGSSNSAHFYTDEELEAMYNNGSTLDDFTNKGLKRRQEAVVHKDPIKHMVVDTLTYSQFGRMVRAFPTYQFIICDDGGDWVDGRKLWTNYYNYKPVIGIKIHQSDSSPIQTAYIELTNLNGNLNNKSKSENVYNIKDDEGYNDFVRWTYKMTGILLSTPKITEDIVKIRNEILNSINLRTGTRLHIRIGYGSNPLNLPICFNGVVAEVENNTDTLSLLAQSDGYELINNVVHTKDDNTTNTVFKYGNEASNIIGGIMIERENKWINWASRTFGEGKLSERSKYGIEHFGIHLGYDGDDADRREYDLLKNVYTATYEPTRYVNSQALFDSEKNIQFFLANKTPWEIFKAVEQTVPEFVCYPMYHQFESRLFFGLPWFNVSYRYNLEGDKVVDYFKSFSQFHIVSSLNSLIANNVKTSKRNLTTNAIAVFSQGGNNKKTPTVYSDRNIESSIQKTAIIDTTVTQDYLGPDGLYKMFGIAVGKSAAIRTATSNILNSWKNTYGGDLVIFGDSSIKPHDYVYLDDMQTTMAGLFKVRETVHSFTMETGFVTSITPGLIAHTTLQNSGASNIVCSMTNLGISISAAYKLRYLSLLNAMTLKPIIILSKVVKNTPEIAKLIKNSASISDLSSDVYKAFKTGDLASEMAKLTKSAKTLLSSVDTAKDVSKLKNLSNIITAIKTESILVSAGSGNPIVPLVTWVATSILFDVMLEKLIDSFAYNHSVYVMPMMFKGQPFISGAKGCSDSFIPGLGESQDNREDEIAESEEEENESTLVRIWESVKDAFSWNEDLTEKIEGILNQSGDENSTDTDTDN